MNATERFLMADVLVKQAGIGSDIGAGAAGLFGPLGAYAHAKVKHPDDENARSHMVSRNAIGTSLGALTGSMAGWPISIATGVPLVPGMILAAILGSAGGAIGSGVANHRQDKLKKLKERRDPDKIEKS